MRRTRIPEQGEASQAAQDERRRPEHDGIAGELLALQRSAGNRAVGSLLAREPATEEKGDGGHPAENVPKGSVSGTVTFPDPIGSMSVESLQIKDGEIAISVPIGSSTPKLLEYAQNGTFIATVVINAAGFTITLEQVVIASAQQSGGQDGGGGSVYVTLSAGNRTIKRDTDEAEKGAPNAPHMGWSEHLPAAS